MSGERPVRVLYFAWARTRAGRGEESLALPEGVTDLAGLLRHLRGLGEGREAALADPSALRFAVNQGFCGPEEPVGPGDEVAIFPPVTGG